MFVKIVTLLKFAIYCVKFLMLFKLGFIVSRLNVCSMTLFCFLKSLIIVKIRIV